MSKAIYTGVNGIARKVKKMYIGVDGVARKVKKAYIGAPNFEARNLPEGYTQVEYIESSGTQYIDTGFAGNQNTRVVMDCKATTLASAGSGPFGSRTKSSSNAYGVFLLPTQAFSNFGTKYAYADFADSYGRLTIDVNRNVATFIGSETVSITSDYSGTFTTPSNLYIGSSYSAGAIYTGDAAWNGYIYSCQIYDNDTLIRDYVPCINPSGEVGLYDVVNAAFYGNVGTGAFVAGSTFKYVARQFFVNEITVNYTGTHSVSQITGTDGVLYNLYTITGSGTLTVSDEVQVWMCGGGAGGSGNNELNGGGGGGYVSGTQNLPSGTYVVSIGAGGASNANGKTTSIKQDGATVHSVLGGYKGSQREDANGDGIGGGNGGSGGGGSGWLYHIGGTGGGISTYPFGITSLKAHSAGGAGGEVKASSYYYRGGAGGTNGNNGGAGSLTKAGTAARASGGTYGGGNGGYYSSGNTSGYTGIAATFYGSGGGGSAFPTGFAGGAGYQGVCYILIPA